MGRRRNAAVVQPGEPNLEAFLDDLARSSLLAREHFRTWRELQKAMAEHKELRLVAPGFFGFTANAYLQVAILEFWKLLDEDPGSASLISFLNLAVKHPEKFHGTSDERGWPPESERHERVSADEVRDSASGDLKRLRQIKKRDAEHLVSMRNNAIAHNNQKNFHDPGWLSEASSITIGGAEALFQELRDITKRYKRFLTGACLTDTLVNGAAEEVARVVYRLTSTRFRNPAGTVGGE